jgi:hypothetical protein
MRQVAIAALLVAVAGAGFRWGTFVAGGSDSYCYLNQAERWASLQLQPVEPLALEAPWPEAPLTFAPAGHRPSSTVPGAIAPICPAGLSMLMAPLVAVGGPTAAFALIPFFGALLVGATYLAGARFGARVGLAAAVLMACNPIFLYQLVQPMSDVPAASLWMLATAMATSTRKHAAVAGGLAAGAAILIRPNLVPLAIPLGAFLLWRPERSWLDRRRAALGFALGAVPGCLLVAFVQYVFYGSPFSSGYGAAGTLFAAGHVVPNLGRYSDWMSQTMTPVWFVAAAAPLLLPGPLTRLFVALFLVNVASYLPYVVFDDWSYVRFLLPTIPLVLILLVAVIDAACRRVRPVIASPVVVVFTLAFVVFFVREAQARNVFRLKALEARYQRAGDYVARRLPPNAMVITSWESGSVRFYSGRRTLVWDSLDPGWLDRAVAYVRTRGYEPFFLFERWEEPIFRQRFGGTPLGALDWPPAAEIASQVRIYRPDDRDRYLRGTQPPTDYSR